MTPANLPQTAPLGGGWSHRLQAQARRAAGTAVVVVVVVVVVAVAVAVAVARYPRRAQPDGTAENNNMAYGNDPLYKMRHALAGVGLALLLSVLAAAFAGAALGDAVGGTYGARVACYAALLLYVVAGAVVLFVKVARHETRPLSPQGVGLWFVSLWLWPALLLLARKKPDS